jgi:serine/threonine protein kinase
MEYVDGSDLENVLANQGSLPLVLSEKKDILHQLLEATAHIHKSGVTHRDIKPANLMLATRSPIHIVLVDFGLSTGQGQFNTTCGTPLYSAAELLIKNQHATNKVDMYAVGVIALQLMYGFHFSRIENRDFRSCLAAIREQRVIMEAKWPRNRLPHPFSFIRRLLSEEPSERPSAMKCLEEPYFQNPLPEEVQVMDYHEQPIAPYQGPQGHGGLISTANLRQPNLTSQYFGDPGRSSSHLASPILGRRQTPTSSLLPPPKRLRMDQPISRHENPMPSISAERQLFFMNSEDYKAPYPPPPLATKERTGLSSIQLPSIFASKGSHRSTDQVSPHTGGVTSHDTTVHNGSTRTSRPGADTGAPTTEQSTAAPSKMSIHSISSPTGSGGYSESGSQQDMLTNQCWYDPMTSMGGGSLMQLVGNNRQQGTTQGQTNAHMGHPENSFLIQSMSYSFLNGDPATIGQPEPSHTSVPQPAAGTNNDHNPVQQYNGTHHHQVAHYQNSHIPTPQHDTPQFHKPIQQAPHQHQQTPLHGTPLHGTPLHGTPLHGTPRHDALPYPTPHDAVPSPHAVDATNMRPTVEEGQTVQPIADATPAEPREDSESTPFSPKEGGGRRDSATMKRRKATSLGDKEKLAREYRLNSRPSKADFRRIQKTVHMTYKQIRVSCASA